jgi:hypothetical protein
MNITTTNYPYDPIYRNLFTVNFNNEILTESCIKITNKYLIFNLNSINGEVPVLSAVNKLIRNSSSFDISINIHDKEGTILYRIFLDDVTFIKIKNLVDYSYSSISDIFNLKVKYTYKEKTLISSNNELRLFKLKKLTNNFMF